MLKNIVRPLLAWYEKNKRDLPWRREKNPYYIWVSEIMLQQTRVEAVKPYFERFIAKLPTVEALAACPEDSLLKLWEGLGYYNRVRNMQRAARRVTEKYGGRLPADVKLLRELPGIGEYTAGAIASIVWDIPVPAVDGNVLRIWARLTASRDDVLRQSVRRRAAGELAAVMAKKGSGELNQAFMDLGSSVCVPGEQAGCDRCPLAFICEAHKKGITAKLPVRKKAASRRLEAYTVLVVRDGSRVAFRKRPAKGLLAGLYEFPSLPGHASGEDVLAFLEGRGLEPLYIERLEPAKHIFSHIEWRMEGYLVRVAALEDRESEDWIFADTGTAEREYPLPAAFGAYTSYINIRLGPAGARKGGE